MVNSVSNSNAAELLQSLQAAKAAQSASAVSSVKAAEETASSSAKAEARYDTVEISEEGNAYVAGQDAKKDNATLLKELNAVGESGLSYVQQQQANLKAGVSASAFLGGASGASQSVSSVSNATGLSASSMNELLSGVSQAKQTQTLLRGAGVSALGLDDTGAAKKPETAEDTDSSESDGGLSNYTEQELSSLWSKGTITAAQYLTEIASRQEREAAEDAAAQSQSTAAPVAVVADE